MLAAMLLRGGAVYLVVVIVIVLPVGHWQERLFGSSVGVATGCILLGAPIVLSGAVGRGFLTAHGALPYVGAANAAAGVSTLLLPPLLHLLGIGWLEAFLVGALLAWLPALVLIALRAPAAASRPLGREMSAGIVRHRVTAWLLAGNLLMLSSLLAVPVVLRWHVADLGADRVADTQLLVSISRLTTTLVLGLLTLMIAQLTSPEPLPGIARRWLGVATGLGLLAVVGLALVGNGLVTWLRGSPSTLSLEENLLATVPAATLCPAIVAVAVAVVRHRWGLIISAWSAALSALVVAAAIDPGGELAGLLALIALACALPLVVLTAGLATSAGRMEPAGRRASEADC
jgi:hypothetical protein